MTKLYKLTTLDAKTRKQTQWGEIVTHTVPIRDTYTLCSPQVLHAYVSSEMAVLLDPAQAGMLPNAILWECEGNVVINDGTKVGCTSITTLRRVPLPAVTSEQRIVFAIRCAMRVYKDEAWTTWAQAWLDGTNSATAAADATAARARAAADAAYGARANAAYAGAYAARAADVVRAAYVAYAAANAAAYAAAADARAARAVRAVAYAATYVGTAGFIAQIASELRGLTK